MLSLVEYSDSGSDVETEKNSSEPESKIIKLSDHKLHSKIQENNGKRDLPLPESIVKLFGTNADDADDPNKHCGKMRTFAHEKGNWATAIHIPYEGDDDFKDMIEELLLCLRPLEFHIMDDFHISLSRTVSIRHHWIESLVDSLQSRVTSLSSFPCELTKLRFYVNDEKTRSFLAIEVISPSEDLKKYVSVVDQCYKEFKLQTYYKDPSFHISIAWCLGDITPKITDRKMEELQVPHLTSSSLLYDLRSRPREIWKTACEENPEIRYLFVKHFVCKTGNKQFQFNVEDT